MFTKILKYFLIFLLSVLFSVVVVIVILSTIDVNNYKEYIATSFQEKTGLSIEIKGNIDLSIEEDLQLEIGHVAVSDSLGVLFEFDTLSLSTLFAWPKDSLIFHHLSLGNPAYHYRTQGIFTDDISSSGSSMFSFSIRKIIIDSISIKNGSFILSNESDSSLVTVSGIDAYNGYLKIDIEKPILEGLYISADGEAKNIEAFDKIDERLSFNFEMNDGYLKLDNTFLDRSNSDLLFTLNFNPEFIQYSFKGKFRKESIQETYSQLGAPPIDFINGTFDADYSFSFAIPEDSLDIKSITGAISITSKNTLLKGVSLDKLIKSFRRTQKFSMKDLGSVLLLGPWGLALSKGGDYAELAFTSSKDSTIISLLYCSISIDSGLIHFEDVAFRTAKNRVVISGEIDIVNQAYKKFAYALLDDESCSEIREEFNGSFYESMSLDGENTKIILGPITNLFKGTSSIIKGKDCSHRYVGKVEAPEKKAIFRSKSKKQKSTQEKKVQEDKRKDKKKRRKEK